MAHYDEYAKVVQDSCSRLADLTITLGKVHEDEVGQLRIALNRAAAILSENFGDTPSDWIDYLMNID